MNLTHSKIQGSWIVVESEIEHLQAGDEIYHFFPDFRFEAEFKNIGDSINCWKYHYEITESGFRYGKLGNLRFEVTAWLESDSLIFIPVHGMKTWFSRVTPDSMPDWVRALHLMKAGTSNGV